MKRSRTVTASWALALGIGGTFLVVAPPAQAAACGPRITADQPYNSITPPYHTPGHVNADNTCFGSTFKFKIDISGGPDTPCKTLTALQNTAWDYNAYPWTGRAHANAIKIC